MSRRADSALRLLPPFPSFSECTNALTASAKSAISRCTLLTLLVQSTFSIFPRKTLKGISFTGFGIWRKWVTAGFVLGAPFAFWTFLPISGKRSCPKKRPVSSNAPIQNGDRGDRGINQQHHRPRLLVNPRQRPHLSVRQQLQTECQHRTCIPQLFRKAITQIRFQPAWSRR